MACDDFRRSQQLGSGLTRRQVIGRGLAVYGASQLPLRGLWEGVAEAATSAPPGHVLVSVFLPGGCDLLDALPPTAQSGTYADLRKATMLSGLAPLGGSGLARHPSLTNGLNGGIAGLYERGRIGLLPGIDYADPDLSHFHSRHFWETGLITSRQVAGWLGRWLDRHGSAANPLQGVSISGSVSPVLRTARAPVAAVASPDDAQFWWNGVWGDAEDAANRAWGESARGGANEAQRAARTAARLAREVAVQLAPYRRRDGKPDPLASPVAYPEESDFADSLKSLAALIAQPLGLRVATVEAPGDFDTHDDQPKELGRALQEVSEALAAFQADLEARRVADRVLTFVWSEFGRRPEANESQGTDHGAGGLAWVQGTRVRSGVLSEYPDLTKLDREGNLAVTVDFRRVYSSLLEQWLGTDASEVIPDARRLGRLSLVA